MYLLAPYPVLFHVICGNLQGSLQMHVHVPTCTYESFTAAKAQLSLLRTRTEGSL